VSDEHVCEPVYVSEGEVVCFLCGAFYMFHSVYDIDTLRECSEVVIARENAAA